MIAGAAVRGSQALDLSIVIPVYNEEQRLPSALALLTHYLDASPLRADVLIVVNGSNDRTGEIALQAAATDARFQVEQLAGRGKGLAVRTGMLRARGNVVMFCDVDFSMPIQELSGLYGVVAGGLDVALASREVAGAHRIGEPPMRHLMGRVFNGLVRVLALPGIQDTQCGFKAFRREVARDVFARGRIDGWAFDVETLFIARKRRYRLREVPITWRYDESSRVHPVRDTIAMLRELLQIRWNALRGLYA